MHRFLGTEARRLRNTDSVRESRSSTPAASLVLQPSGLMESAPQLGRQRQRLIFPRASRTRLCCFQVSLVRHGNGRNGHNKQPTTWTSGLPEEAFVRDPFNTLSGVLARADRSRLYLHPGA
ncbi:hypothetical protein AOLI_G00261600 [Acnodon oligacanthus]